MILNNEEISIWPLTVILDRYSGTYSSGIWHAWNIYPNQIPDGPFESDIECCEFWNENKIIVGLGNTPELAIKDLSEKLKI